MHIQPDTGARLVLSARLTRLETLQPSRLESHLVNLEAPLFRHDLGEIDRETVRVVQPPDVFTTEGRGA